jgi:hypothetical protein
VIVSAVLGPRRQMALVAALCARGVRVHAMKMGLASVAVAPSAKLTTEKAPTTIINKDDYRSIRFLEAGKTVRFSVCMMCGRR